MLFYSLKFDRFPPVPWQRARSVGKVRFNDPKYSEYKTALANAIKSAFCRHVILIPKVGDPTRKKHLNEVKYFLIQNTFISADRGDDDNYRKTLEDALQQSGLIADDKQIRGALTFTLIDKENPRVEFILIPLKTSQFTLFCTGIEEAVRSFINVFTF